MSKHILFVESSSTGAGEKAHEYAKSQGYEVTLLVRRPDVYPREVIKTADRIKICDTNDIEVMLETVRGLHEEQAIDGITTTADFYVPQAARAAEELGLPGLSFHAALGVRNKYKMRQSLERYCPRLNPLFRLVQTEEEALATARVWGYPFIAKPQDLNDSLNVKLIRSGQEMAAYMEASKRWQINSFNQPIAKGVLLEGFIDGEEFSVETMQPKDGEIQLIGVTRNVLEGSDRGHFAEVAASFPVRTREAEILFTNVREALAHLQIDCGVIHTECRMKDGQVKILEINPRLIGDKVGSHVIELALGVSPLKHVVEIALGSQEHWKPAYQKGGALYGVWMQEKGVFGGIENLDEIQKLPGVKFVELTAKIGQTYDLPTSNKDVLALVITEADHPEEALKLARQAAEKAKVLVLTR